jgi:chromosome segregation ATPase
MTNGEISLEFIGQRLESLQGQIKDLQREADHTRLVNSVLHKEMKTLHAEFEAQRARLDLIDDRLDRIESKLDRILAKLL